jgi:glycerol-3-phosphate dehydrogenase (NAD(P)+)
VTRLAIIGGGAWGTALGIVAQRAGSVPVLWARDRDVVGAINERHENPFFLPGVLLDPLIVATSDLGTGVANADAALLAVPAQFLRAVILAMRPSLRSGIPVLICAKGIEAGSLKMMSEVCHEILPGLPIAVLSGPSFAAEVARDEPTAVTIASYDVGVARAFVAGLGTSRFRPYLSDDPIGVQIGGALKNVLAIACGIVTGRGMGDNTRASLVTRGLAEMIRLGLAKGGREDTFRGLSGLGDLVLTCNATQSRNYNLGLALGRGEELDGALSGSRSVVEGVDTAPAVVELARQLGVEMPISEAVEAVLHRGAAIDQTIEGLLRRPFRSE